jgi:hypothetical protein
MPNPGFQIVEKTAWLDSGISYHMGVDGISMLFVILTTFLMPLCILASLAIGRQARQGIHDRVSHPRDADDRRVLRARHRAVLRVLRGRPHSDVHHHRGVGRQASRLRQLQVLPLHAARLGADAARHHGHVLARPARPTFRRCWPTTSRRNMQIRGCGSPSSRRSR